MIVVMDDEVDSEQHEDTKEFEVLLRVDKVQLSMNSVIGLTSLHFMKIKEELGGMEVVTLIDCGVTHNFISKELVKKLNIPVKETASYGVALGTGAPVLGSGICRGVMHRIQDITVVEDFLPFGIGNSDLILRLKWLFSVPRTNFDWHSLTLKIPVEGKEVVLQGDPSLSKSTVSLKTMVKTIQQEG